MGADFRRSNAFGLNIDPGVLMQGSIDYFDLYPVVSVGLSVNF